MAELREAASREELERIIKETKGGLIVAYSAPWCGYCRMLKVEFEAIISSQKDCQVVTINVDTNREGLADKGITGLPFIEFYRDGKLTSTQTGFLRRDELLRRVA